MEEKKEGFEQVEETIAGTSGESAVDTAEPAAETVAEPVAEPAVEPVAESTANEADTAASEGMTPETTQEIVAETPVEAQKKSKKGLLIGLGVAAVVAVGAFAAVTLTAKDPKTVVIDAFKGAYSEKHVTPSEEIFGFGDMYQYSRSNPMEGGMELKLDSIGTDDETMQMLVGAGFRLDERANPSNHQADLDMALIYGGMDLVTGQVYMDDNQIALASPELTASKLLWNYREEIPEDTLIAQALAESGLDMDLTTYMSDYMDYVWDLYDTENKKFDMKGLWERYKTGSKAIDDFKTAMTVEKGEKGTYTVNGAEVSCKGYDVTITKDALVQFMETTSDFFLQDESIKRDVVEYVGQIANVLGNDPLLLQQAYGGTTPEEIQTNLWTQAEDGMDTLIQGIKDYMGDTVTMKVYVDSKGNLAAYDVYTTVTVQESNTVTDVNAHVVLEGGSYPTQNSNTTLTFDNTEESIELALLRQGTYDGRQLTCDVSGDIKLTEGTYSLGYTGTYDVEDGAYHMEFMAAGNGTGGSVSLTGNVTDLQKGQGFTMNMDEVAVKNDAGEALAVMSGNYYMRPYTGEITAPEGTEFNMITATEEDWTDLGNEASMNLFGLLMQVIAGSGAQ